MEKGILQIHDSYGSFVYRYVAEMINYPDINCPEVPRKGPKA